MKARDERVVLFLELINVYFLNRKDWVAFKKNKNYFFIEANEDWCTALFINHMSKGETRVGLLNVDKEGKSKWICLDIDGPAPLGSAKEHKYPVKDALIATITIITLLKNIGFKPYVEMSGSGTGFHIWMFFSTPVDGELVKETLAHVLPKFIPLRDGGFADPLGNKGVEIFPKHGKTLKRGNIVFAPFWSGAKGNGNQFVEINEGGVYPYSPLHFEYSDIDIWHSLVSEFQALPVLRFKRGKPNKCFNDHTPMMLERNLLNNVFKGCEALRRLGHKGTRVQLSHVEGFALLSFMQRFAKGVDDFCRNIVGWGESESDLNQIQSFIDNKYSPYSCQKLIDEGICSKPSADACMFSNENRSPNPIRFAYQESSLKQDINNILERHTGGPNGE